jgi:uncharacterized membrane protein
MNGKLWSCVLRFSNCFFSLFLSFLFLLAFLPGQTWADDRSLTLEQIHVEAEVLPDASMVVTERITVDFSGQWNGFFVRLPQDSPIREIKVLENGTPYTFNPGTEYGPPGTYLTKVEEDGILVDWSISAVNEIRTFDLSYRVLGAVKLHEDTAELYRKFISEANGNKIGKVEVNLKLPSGVEQYSPGEDIRIWGHGPLTGEVSFKGSDTVSWVVENLPAHTFLEGRVVMPTALFTDAPPEAYTKEVALPTILKEEELWAEKANRERSLAKMEYLGGIAVIVLALVGLVMLWRRFGRRHKVSFTGDYYRELPANYSPAELSVLWNFKNMKAQDLTATILDLARRKFISLEEKIVQEQGILRTKEVTTYLVRFLPPPEGASFRRPEEGVLKPHEKELLEFLRQDIGAGRESIYLTEIEKYAKKQGQKFYDFWKTWTAGVIAASEEHSFFERRGKLLGIAVAGGVALFILGLVLIVIGAGVLGAAFIIAGVLFFTLPLTFKRRSLSGEEDFVRWQAFRRFLLHFSEMHRSEIPALVVWEYYLVYAVTLGVAKQVIEQLELVFPDKAEDGYYFGLGGLSHSSYVGLKNLNQSFENIGSTFERALHSAQKAMSTKSSGSGAGGGFSSGGGFGGGGSSYGGR